MTNAKHTPTPWELAKSYDDNEIRCSKGELICSDTSYYPVAPSEDDMAHIVKCVNMHDELVEALRSVLENFNSEQIYETMNKAEETLKKAGAL